MTSFFSIICFIGLVCYKHTFHEYIIHEHVYPAWDYVNIRVALYMYIHMEMLQTCYGLYLTYVHHTHLGTPDSVLLCTAQ